MLVPHEMILNGSKRFLITANWESSGARSYGAFKAAVFTGAAPAVLGRVLLQWQFGAWLKLRVISSTPRKSKAVKSSGAKPGRQLNGLIRDKTACMALHTTSPQSSKFEGVGRVHQKRSPTLLILTAMFWLQDGIGEQSRCCVSHSRLQTARTIPASLLRELQSLQKKAQLAAGHS